MSLSDCHRLIVIVWLSDHHRLIMFAQIAKWFPLMWHRRLCSRRIDESREQERGLCSLCHCVGLCNTSPCCVDYRLELCGSTVWFGKALALWWELIVPWVALYDAVCSTRCVTLLHCVALCGSVCGLVGLSSYGENSAYPPHLPTQPPHNTTPSTEHLEDTEIPIENSCWKYTLKYRELKNKYKIALPISTGSSVHTVWN